jgi:hypothetical protein
MYNNLKMKIILIFLIIFTLIFTINSSSIEFKRNQKNVNNNNNNNIKYKQVIKSVKTSKIGKLII